MSQAATALPRDTAIAEPNTAGRARFRRRLRLLLMAGGVLAVAVGAFIYWLQGGQWMDTDDAYVTSDKVALSTDVSGVIASIPVREGEQVQAGQVLFQLDPRQFQIALDSAKADLAQTRLTLVSQRQDYQRLLRDIATREAQVQADQATFDRYAQLVGRGDLPRQQYDDARYKLAADQAALQSAGVAAQVALARLNDDPNVDVTTLPSYRLAEERVAEAQRQLDHATVRAPFDGIVTQVESLQPGTYLVSATAALTNTGAVALVSTDRVWVDANLKETDLTHVKPGDHAEITVDSYPGRTWSGTVDTISPGTGSEFSILPAQNASGNWVKVVQRVPVRVRIDYKPGDPVLRAGMSVVVAIDTGHRRSLAELF